MTELSIKELRKKTGMSQTQFAARFNLNVRNLQGWEQGRKRPPGGIVEMIAQIIEQNNIAPPEGWVSVKELANECGRTTAAIHAHIKNYAEELKGHTYSGCRTLLLDDYAQEFIKDLVARNEKKKARK